MKNPTCTYSVSGMHCAACEVLIQKKLSKIPDVKSVRVRRDSDTISVTFAKGKRLQEDELNEMFYDLGYTFSQDSQARIQKQGSWMQAVALIILFGVIYLILEDSKVLAGVTLDESSSVLAFLILGVVASLSSCAALVGGMLLSMSKKWNNMYGGKNESKRMLPFVLFNAGRLVSFVVLGGVVGAIGSVFHLSLSFTALLIIIVSIVMLIIGLQMLGVRWATRIKLGFPKFLSQYASNEENFSGEYMPLVAGASTFFLPCGFTLIAQTVALASGSFINGAVMMGSFALGTLPMLAFISFSSLKMQKNKSFNATFNLVVGIFLIFFAVFNTNSQLNVLGLPSLSDVSLSQSATALDEPTSLGVTMSGEGADQIQEIRMEANGFEYAPKSITLKAGIPTKLIVTTRDVVGCAQAMWLGGLSDEVLYLNKPQVETEFTPQAGSYKISCTMGMVQPVMVRVN
ncbi:sulfite exporter TauE/SafE family protein [Candidatus Woesebacteria bacterium]|nr:sulfite exporter TauE/SafE family protein [Candidatus Woesebacteria bacterium]